MDKVILPELGEGINSAVVACWHVEEGQNVQEGDDIVELVTDKATFNVPATSGGRLTKRYFKKGEEAKIGAVLAEIQP